MLLGAVDIGTNSTRLLIAKMEKGQVVPVVQRLQATRLGQGMSEKSYLGAEPAERTLRALRGFQRLMRESGVERARAVATSAVREALNGREFVQEAEAVLGFPVHVVTGEQEAVLSYRGATGAIPEITFPVVVDIGGGSTEITYQNERGRIIPVSLPLGAVRCTEQGWPENKIQSVLRDGLHPLARRQLGLVGVGGTITTLAAVDLGLEFYDWKKVHKYRLTYERILDILKYLAALPLEERKRVPGLQPERADIIVAGTIILKELMRLLNTEFITVSEADILHGIILELYQQQI
ncbi:bifunctional 3-dehydroquinate synthase/phosphatase AroB [Calderihabitans maritimus]|uniref:Bifunctional 3-dehydroquinate synthase/phosphatase AroB n=2 Tax=Calderihabitans maritimus TaxID=1246530 RepID=A0A1Z5HSD5_9FIRM|nr:bifunctional 3-dehydroquinate synthase/phosphatase AroB [Calderihabitans maritimus]